MKRQSFGMCFAALQAAVLSLSFIPLHAQDYDPPPRVARMAYLAGEVSMLFPDAQQWAAASPNYPIIGGDRIYTGDDGRAAIQNGSIDARLGHGTDVTLTNLDENYEQLGLAQGAIRVRVFALEREGVVEVDTPNGAVIIQQPGDYRIDAYPNQGALVEVNQGSVQITGPGLNQIVDQGQTVQLSGENPIEVGLVETPYADDLDQWSMDRDRHILNSVSARYVSTQMPGYDDLDDYGSWAPTPDYGPVWYPTAMPYGWAPYTFGHWAYVAPWGWTWVDDAPWGYAPFHYGRWAIIEGRWGWVPGPPRVVPVYSPALVAFVGGGPHFSIDIHIGGGGGVAAWFPLGVGEPYVPWYRCTTNYVRNVNVTNVNVTVIHNTTIVNNYNTFITNTRTVNNVNQIDTRNIQFVNRTRVVAVPANLIQNGASVQHAQVRLDEHDRQQFARAPVVVDRPPIEVPTRPMGQFRNNVARPIEAPRLLTPRGRAPATPIANAVRFNPQDQPKPQPSAEIRPAIRPVVPNIRPVGPARAYEHPVTGAPASQPPQPGQTNPQPPAINQGRPNQPNFENRPPQNNQPPNQPQNQPQQPQFEHRPYTPPPGQAQPQQPVPPPSNPQQPQFEHRPFTPPPGQAQPQQPAPAQPTPQQPQFEHRPYTPPPGQAQPQQPVPPPSNPQPPQFEHRPYTPPPGQAQPQQPVPPQPNPQQPQFEHRPYTPPPAQPQPPAQQNPPRPDFENRHNNPAPPPPPPQRPQVESRPVPPPPPPPPPQRPQVENRPNMPPPPQPKAAPKPESKPDNPKPEEKHDDKKPNG